MTGFYFSYSFQVGIRA